MKPKTLILAAAFALAAGAFAQAQKQRTLNVYNWSDYIEPSVLEDFAKNVEHATA